VIFCVRLIFGSFVMPLWGVQGVVGAGRQDSTWAAIVSAGAARLDYTHRRYGRDRVRGAEKQFHSRMVRARVEGDAPCILPESTG
jgi:hypothetical protein